MSNVIKRIVITGIFDLLKQWWVWLALAVMTGFLTGTITQKNILVILNKILSIIPR